MHKKIYFLGFLLFFFEASFGQVYTDTYASYNEAADMIEYIDLQFDESEQSYTFLYYNSISDLIKVEMYTLERTEEDGFDVFYLLFPSDLGKGNEARDKVKVSFFPGGFRWEYTSGYFQDYYLKE